MTPELSPLASRLADTIDTLVSELAASMPVPPAFTGLLQKLVRSSPPSDEDILRTFAVIRDRLNVIEGTDVQTVEAAHDGE